MKFIENNNSNLYVVAFKTTMLATSSTLDLALFPVVGFKVEEDNETTLTPLVPNGSFSEITFAFIYVDLATGLSWENEIDITFDNWHSCLFSAVNSELNKFNQQGLSVHLDWELEEKTNKFTLENFKSELEVKVIQTSG